MVCWMKQKQNVMWTQNCKRLNALVYVSVCYLYYEKTKSAIHLIRWSWTQLRNAKLHTSNNIDAPYFSYIICYHRSHDFLRGLQCDWGTQEMAYSALSADTRRKETTLMPWFYSSPGPKYFKRSNESKEKRYNLSMQ